ncbi:MAG: hypothetical protein FWC57_01955 [Endomicrobia bacterium]|nr:hypothetical protein [Endomicrobiia bacterium]
MKKSIIFPLFLCFLICGGCVSAAKYDAVSSKLEQSQMLQARLKQENAKLGAEVKNLEYRNNYMNGAISGYEERINTLEKTLKSSNDAKIRMIAELAATRHSLREKISMQEIELKGLNERNYKLINQLETRPAETNKDEK